MTKNFTDYFLCMVLLFLSGSPALMKNSFELYISVFFLLVLGIAVKRGLTLNKKAFIVVGIFTALTAAHMAVFGKLAVFAGIGFLLHIGIAVLIAATIPQFPRYFVRCMAIVCLVSLFFYFLVQLPGLQDIFAPYDLADEHDKINILLYTFYQSGKSMTRNSGIFWEPGALAGYCALALFCVAVFGKKLKVTFIEVFLIIFALGVTLSTMGYIAFAVVCGVYIVRKFSGKNPLLVYFGMPIALIVLLLVGWQLADSIPFLKEKIIEQQADTDTGRGKYQINRFGNAQYDLEFVSSRPIVGWSANVETRVAEDPLAMESIKAQGNALTGFAVRFGIIGWVTMMAAFFTAFLAMSRSLPMALAGLVLIAVMFTGEKYMNFPLIMVFMFLGQKHARALAGSRFRRRRIGRAKNAPRQVPGRRPPARGQPGRGRRTNPGGLGSAARQAANRGR